MISDFFQELLYLHDLASSQMIKDDLAYLEFALLVSSVALADRVELGPWFINVFQPVGYLVDYKFSMILDGQVIQSCFGTFLIAWLAWALLWLFVFKIELIDLGQLLYEGPGLILSFDVELHQIRRCPVSAWSAQHLGLLPNALDICTELV